jgi:hypothetical protein
LEGSKPKELSGRQNEGKKENNDAITESINWAD